MPALETLKTACSGSFKSVDHLQKAVGKHRTEVEADFADILSGVMHMKSNKGGSMRWANKPGAFHDVKYSEVAKAKEAQLAIMGS